MGTLDESAFYLSEENMNLPHHWGIPSSSGCQLRQAGKGQRATGNHTLGFQLANSGTAVVSPFQKDLPGGLAATEDCGA